ncbi:MAG: NADAR family protein, partial [Bacteroidota bacterium]|nr:NADAR family protein [Bacteroidota bacterium]
MSFQFTLEKPMPPVWMMYPDILQFSLGWRMGYGESYSHDLGDWLKTLPKKDQKEYDKMFPRPSFWHEDFEGNYYDLIPFWQPGGAPKYSLGKLENNTAELFIFFWKPSPGIVDKSCLSQWQPCKFRVDASDYASTEQYMMAEKARLFGDEEAEEKIMRSSDPKEIKALGKSVRKFNQNIWDKVKY